MPELPKMPLSASPVARSGAGDISERELSRERHNLQTTPPARMQQARPKKQLFSAPVNKFTANVKSCPSPNLARIRSCLDEYRSQTPRRPMKIGPKAVSMEDLTPTKRIKQARTKDTMSSIRSPRLHSIEEQQAAAMVARFMLRACWRRRREEVRCLRKTLEFQVSSSERLRIQVSTLKSLLDSDNAKVRLAMRELERLKQLLKEKEIEKNVLEREKLALENDICTVEDKASEMSIGWRNCRNELEGVRQSAALCEQALSIERAKHCEARAQRDHAFTRLEILEVDLAQHETLLSSAEAEVAALRNEADDKERMLRETSERLECEERERERCTYECACLNARISLAAEETSALRGVVEQLRGELLRLDRELRETREQLEWWPRPLTKMLGAARSWLRYPKRVPEAVLWSLIPARHGC